MTSKYNIFYSIENCLNQTRKEKKLTFIKPNININNKTHTENPPKIPSLFFIGKPLGLSNLDS